MSWAKDLELRRIRLGFSSIFAQLDWELPRTATELDPDIDFAVKTTQLYIKHLSPTCCLHSTRAFPADECALLLRKPQEQELQRRAPNILVFMGFISSAMASGSFISVVSRRRPTAGQLHGCSSVAEERDGGGWKRYRNSPGLLLCEYLTFLCHGRGWWRIDLRKRRGLRKRESGANKLGYGASDGASRGDWWKTLRMTTGRSMLRM